jgi:3-oxoacyl-[acyl-carrier-protein] synthase-3
LTVATIATPFASRITGTGSAYPERRVSNEDISKLVETNDAWIRERTGIAERRIARPGDDSETNSALGAAAAIRALEMAGKRPEQIDAIFYATCTPDTLLPSTACWLQKRIGATRAWGIDLNAACSGFVFGMATADQFIRSGSAQTVLVVGADLLTAFTNWDDRGSCILFGDGAGAAVLERVPSDSPHRILSTHLHTDGNLWDLFHIPAGGSKMETTPERHLAHLDKMHMKGREIFKEAVRTLADFAFRAVEANGLTLDDIDWVIPHQANLRIIEAVSKRIDLPMEKIIVNIQRYGNTSSATVPTALDEAVRDGRVKPGQLILMDVFGAGLTYGSLLVRW